MSFTRNNMTKNDIAHFIIDLIDNELKIRAEQNFRFRKEEERLWKERHPHSDMYCPLNRITELPTVTPTIEDIYK